MNVGPEEARQMLQGVEDVTSRTKKMIAYAGGDILFIVWGIIWFVGGIGTHFIPVLVAGHPQSELLNGMLPACLWAVLVAAGIIISYRVGRNDMPTKCSYGKSIGLMWWFLYLFLYLWIALLFPFIRIEGQRASHMFWTHMGAIAATVPMFAYVMFGLFFDRYMVWIGLGVTALMMVGVYVFEPFFYLWMAFVGGGALAGTGLLIRNRWKQP